jgi:preprotein translocase subunit SecA
MVSRAIASAQGQVEGRNAEIRKNILKYDDVMNRQREAIYADRRQILKGEDISATFQSFLEETVNGIVAVNLPEGGSQDWDLEQLWVQLKQVYPIGIEISEVLEAAGSRAKLTRTWLIEEILSDARIAYANRTKEVGEEVMRELERRVMLSVIDRKWRDHLYEMDYLKEGIGLRAMAQRDPLVEYQREGYGMFIDMMAGIREEAVQFLFNIELKQAEPQVEVQAPQQLTFSAPDENGEVDSHNEPNPAVKPVQKPKQGGSGSSFFKN